MTDQEVKVCTTCKVEKPISDFHRMGKGKRHCYCKPCLLARPRKRKKVNRTSNNLRLRYGISIEQRDEMLAAQGGVCAICKDKPARAVVDHCHYTGLVRGILCHACNIKLHGIENTSFLNAALEYLGVKK